MAGAESAAAEDGALRGDLAKIQHHLAGLDHSPANDAMIERIRGAAMNGRQLTEGEQNFMNHELTEAKLMEEGMPYGDAHAIAGETHPTYGNYDPEVIRQFPSLFNQNWRNHWGIR